MPVSNEYVWLCACQGVCTFVVFTDRESCTKPISTNPATRPISTNPASMESREYGITRGSISRAVSTLSQSPGCCGCCGVFCVGWIFGVFFFDSFFFERTRPAASVRPPCLIYLSTTGVFCHERQRPHPERLNCHSSVLVKPWQ